MMTAPKSCPLTTGKLIDEYFIENRTRLLDIAAYLDRLDRSSDGADPSGDFRMQAFEKCLRVLADSRSSRLLEIQMLLSDQTTEPREALDQKSAFGAFRKPEGVR